MTAIADFKQRWRQRRKTEDCSFKDIVKIVQVDYSGSILSLSSDENIFCGQKK